MVVSSVFMCQQLFTSARFPLELLEGISVFTNELSETLITRNTDVLKLVGEV